MNQSLNFLLTLGAHLDRRPRALNGLSIADALIASHLSIRNREGRLAPLVPNRAQQELGRDPNPRKIVLKARQLGITTYIAARFFIKTITHPGTLTVQVAHDQQSAEEIFKIVHRFWENLPIELRQSGGSGAQNTAPLRLSRCNVRQIVFPALDSEYRVETAADPNAGRGLTIQNLHCSEVARWPRRAEETLASLRAAVPQSEDAEIILESTPNGAGGIFYQEWQRAQHEAGGYSRHFFPWWYEPSYRIAPEVAENPENFDRLGAPRKPAFGLCGDFAKSEKFEPDNEELGLMTRHGLDTAQILYRRTIQSNFRVLAPQEFAEDAAACFLASGDCIFDLEIIQRRLPFCAQHYCEQRENGALRVWYPPASGRSYIIGADPAGGGSNGDFACAQVIDRATGLQCAELRAHLTPQELAVRLAALAREYNDALLVVERNNHGHGVLAHLSQMEAAAGC